MSTEAMSKDGAQPTPSATCRVCGTVVPVGVFCGSCGARLSPQRGDGPDWLRARAYAAAPGEHLLRVSVVSSLFPHLPHRSRAAFRVGLAALVVVLAVFAVLRWQAPMIAISALGLPLLFLIYLQESDVYDDLPVRTLLLTAVAGAGLGVGWALLTGPIVARSYTFAVGGGLPHEQVLSVGLGIPVGGAVLMLVPAVLVRLLRSPTREALDGYLIGSLGAIAYTAAATLTRLAPQLATGGDRPAGGLLIQAGIQGVAVPLTAAAAGGLVGAALWYTRRADPPVRGVAWAALLPAVVVVLGLYAGLGLLDVARLPHELQLVAHLVVAALAILALRIALHTALLHEAQEMITGEPLLCAHCHHVVPDMAFCPNCGVAVRASSRSSRNARRLSRPVPAGTTAEAAPVWTGYAVPAPSYTAAPVRYTSHTRLFVILGAVVALVVAAAVAVSLSMAPTPPPRPTCPPHCGRHPIGPPVGTPRIPLGAPAPAESPGGAQPHLGRTADQAGPPVQSYPRFTPGDGSFSVAYQSGATLESNGVRMRARDGLGEIRLLGEPAGNQTSRQIAQNWIRQNFPGATIAYPIPNAMVGYQPGYGEIDDYYPQHPHSSATHVRVLVVVAVKNQLALIATAHGPYLKFVPSGSNPDAVTDHPSGADFVMAEVIGHFINSFTWRGDPSR